MQQTYPYHNQAVRDLAWACFGPPLVAVQELHEDKGVRDCLPPLTPQRLAWLESLDRDATRLDHYIAHHANHRLGSYFEALWQFFLHADPATTLLAHNLPVHDGQRTRGEFDLLYFCRARQRPVHLELAVKFFLATAIDGHTYWLGPDRRDRLDLKLAHLLERQVRLGEASAGSACLRDLGIEQPLREVALRGYLFGRAGQTAKEGPDYSDGSNACHWLPSGEVADYTQGLQTGGVIDRFIVLPKLRWLSPAVQQHTDEVLPAHELARWVQARLGESPYPILLAGLDRAGHERCRFFVTPNDWPH